MPTQVTLKKKTSLNTHGEPVYNTGTSYYARILSNTVEIFDESIRTVVHARKIFLEPDAQPALMDKIVYGGRDYFIKDMVECVNHRNERHHWELAIR